jgi:hypothetical protein
MEGQKGIVACSRLLSVYTFSSRRAGDSVKDLVNPLSTAHHLACTNDGQLTVHTRGLLLAFTPAHSLDETLRYGNAQGIRHSLEGMGR